MENDNLIAGLIHKKAEITTQVEALQIQLSPNNSSDRPKSAQATKHLGQRFHCKKLHQTAYSHSCER